MNKTITVCILIAFLPGIAIAQIQQNQSDSAQTIEVISQEHTQLENQSRHEKGNKVIHKLIGGAGQPVLDTLRQDFPFLADAVID
jgi:4-carboxymuconolactone decarboxylase